ncbi:MAG: dCTP deaminase [Patescibacteria group bacterium]|jgi:dCTP deaminase
MILTGKKIKEEVKKGKIVIDPFDESKINPNSYDFRLFNKIKIYKERILDVKKVNEAEEVEIPPSGFVLKQDVLYLSCTVEIMGSNFYVPIIRGRSSTARLGIFIHITADLIDIGSINRWTLMMHAVQPVKIYPYMLIGQVTFWVPKGKITLYKGKYQGSKKPMSSLAYKDF